MSHIARKPSSAAGLPKIIDHAGAAITSGLTELADDTQADLELPACLDRRVANVLKPKARIPDAAVIRSEIEAATSPDELIEIEAKLDGIISYMRRAGVYDPETIRPMIEARMLARWRLGNELAKVERGQGARSDLTSGAERPKFKDFIKTLKLAETAAKKAQRIATLPRELLDKAFADAARLDILPTLDDLIERAKPFWHKEQRKERHQKIALLAAAAVMPGLLGPFALLYLDPPWRFLTFAPSGQDSPKTPDQHYPTLSDAEIAAFKIGDQTIPELAAKDAAMFLWCTSSNFLHAAAVMEGWGFVVSASAIWDKQRVGHGLVFRNQHEVLLYGTRGNMPGPQYLPPSVFRYPRGEHSAKPTEIRAEIDRMFPDFDARHRIELFARGQTPDWTCVGFEAQGAAK